MSSAIIVLSRCFVLLIAPYVYADDASNQRVSIAISGGASKGAYEAGLNWAIVHILRYETENDTALKGKFRPFEAASMAGASAGGINAIMSAMAWCLRPEAEKGIASTLNDNIFRNLWLEHDINTLLPASAKSQYYARDDAVLARKSLLESAEALRSLWESPVFRKDCRVPIGVTVTRVEPEKMAVGDIGVKNQRFTFPFEFRTHDDGTAGFYFDPKDYPLLLDYSMVLIPHDTGKPEFQIDNQRIIDVVMTSAAFPVAFGRKRLPYCRIAATYETGTDAAKDDSATRDGELICPEGYELSEAEFADGGLFDNLPIGLARTLAEENKRSSENPLPVTYIYLDPNRLRYKLPSKRQFEKCLSDNPPKACQEIDYSFFSESRLLLGALGTAQSYELYRELTSDTWSYNLSQIAYQTADLIEASTPDKTCEKELPFFAEILPCHSALRSASRFLEISYDRIDAPITQSFSINKLQSAGLVKRCKESKADSNILVGAECYIDFVKFRKDLTQRLQTILESMPKKNEILLRRLRNSEYTIHSDRIIRVSSRGGPITGELLESFAAFLDLKFREYDYYVGVYDAVMQVAHVVCGHHFSARRQVQDYRNCLEAVVKRLHHKLGIPKDKQAHYIFALLAQWEYGNQSVFQFAYNPMPEVVRDMQIIHEGLWNSLAAEWRRSAGIAETSSGEVQFFAHLKAQGFTPTPTEDGSRPLLADIIQDPDLWTHELTRRFTERLIVLEKEAARIYAEREPDPGKRPETNEGLMGGASFVLRSSTYKYPDFDFAPSTAPKEWKWRYVIPYEIAFDLVEGPLMFTWQPAWVLSKDNLLAARGTIAFAKGIIGEESQKTRDNFFILGIGYSHLTGGHLFSSYGITPGYYRFFRTPESGDADAFGGEIHLGMLSNKLRFALGTRDFDQIGDSYYFTFGVTDIPGIFYWFTR
ncbi:patatin-like phospholipase family protein [Kaarinaea lacus]